MKIKNLVFGVAGVLAIVSSANALDEAGCNRSSKMFWVRHDSACVPRDVCSNEKFSEYCIRDFSTTQVRHVGRAEGLAGAYLKNWLGEGAGIDCKISVPDAGDKKSFFGQNYIPCVTQAGHYYVFEFEDTTESFSGTPHAAFQALCKSFGGTYDGYNTCSGLTKVQCEIIDDQMDDAFVGDDDTKYNETTQDCVLD